MPRIRLLYALLALLVLDCKGDRPRSEPESDTARTAIQRDDLRGDRDHEPLPDSVPETAPSSESPPPPSEIVFRVPIDIVVTFNNRPRYGGTYRASGIARVCGRNPYQLPGMEKSWVVEFPVEGDSPIRDLTLTAKQLNSGASSHQYHLSMKVLKSGGVSPSYVIRTGEDVEDNRSKQKGTVSLQEEGYIARIHLEGRNARGEQVIVSITCKRGESH
jgi:hypothetical protein